MLAQRDVRFARCDWSEFDDLIEPPYCGGVRSRGSVFNGLPRARDTVGGSDWVLGRFRAGPSRRDELDRLFGSSTRRDRGLLAVPVADTLKRANRETRVAATEPRDGLWLAQTPQMFRYRLLIEALRAADPAVATDEARAVEGLGLKPKLVMGDTRNIKVTYSEDLELAPVLASATSVAPGETQKRNNTEPPRAQARQGRREEAKSNRKPSNDGVAAFSREEEGCWNHLKT